MLGILDLYDGDERHFALTFEELHQRLGYTRSTLYRYLKALTDAGLLSSLPGLGYVLGSRIIELDYKIRLGDPLIRAARPAMLDLVARYACVALLCRRFRHQILCVHQEVGASNVRSTYERGRARQLLRGAASLAVLANLRGHQRRRLYGEMPEEFAAAGLGETLEEVKTVLKTHRQRGWVTTAGQVTPGVVGIAAPVFDSRPEVLGSLSLTLPETELDPERIPAIAADVVRAAATVSAIIGESETTGRIPEPS